MTKQVRLDDDVAEAIEKAAAREGVSMSAAANRWLRRGLQMRAPGATSASPAPGPATARAATRAGSCTHPVGRRIGDRCGQCGASIRR